MNSTINQNSSISSETIPIEKKKRGRKKQNVALEVKEEPVVEVVKPHPKKRGRKPKGGKIICNRMNKLFITKKLFASSYGKK